MITWCWLNDTPLFIPLLIHKNSNGQWKSQKNQILSFQKTLIKSLPGVVIAWISMGYFDDDDDDDDDDDSLFEDSREA